MIDPIDPIDDEEDDAVVVTDPGLDAAFAARQARKSTDAPPAPPEPAAAASQGTPTAPADPATAPAPAEPFEGYSALPEAVRKRFDDAQAERQKLEAEAKRLAVAEEKARNDAKAMRERGSRAQSELDRLRGNGGQQPPHPKTQAPVQGLTWDAWKKALSPEEKRWAESFPEEAHSAFVMASRVAETVIGQRLKEIESKNEERFSAAEARDEKRQIEREHPDWQKYAATTLPDGRLQCATKEGADYWNWVFAQRQDIQDSARGATAAECAQALSVYKWEEANPGFRETIKDDLFEAFLSARPRAYREVIRGMDVSERELVMAEFADACAEAQRQLEAEDPNAAKAKSLAERRARQAGNVTPSVRPTTAPASAAEGQGDAGLDAAFQLRKQWKSRNR